MKTQIKNTIITASFLLLSTLTYGQTKEETISWLKEKLEKCFDAEGGNDAKNIVISINECEVTIKHKIFFDDGTLFLERTMTFPTFGASINYGYLKYQNNVIHAVTIDKSKGYHTRDSFVNQIYFLEDKEHDLYARVKKALDHLATFCPKKKETF